MKEVEEEGYQAWEVVKDAVLRPGVAGGLIGIGEHYLPPFSFACPCLS